MSRRAGWLGGVCMAACLCAGDCWVISPCPAQPPPATPGDKPAPKAGDILRRLAMRYRAGPTCERVNVEVRPESGRVGRSAFVVRLDPRLAKGVADPAILLELGQLRAAAGGGRFTAVHVHNLATFFAAPVASPLTPSALRSVIPPLPLPQLDLVNWGGEGDAPGPSELATYAEGIVWTGCEADPRRPDRVTVSGTCRRGTVVLTARGDALQALEIKLSEPPTTIKLSIAPILPCRPEDLRLDTAGRVQVESMAELGPQSGLLGIGAAVPELPVTAASGQLQRLKELYTPPVEWQPNVNADRLVLLIVRDRQATGEAAERKVGRIRLAEIAAEFKQLRKQSYAPDSQPAAPDKPKESALGLPPMNFAQVLVWDQPPAADVLLGALKREQPVWGDRLLWTTEPKSTADLFSTAKNSVVVILDGGQHLVAAVPIEDDTTIEQLMDQVTLSLLESADERNR